MRNNLAEKAKKILPYITIIIACSCVFFVPIEDADEIWNYSFARNISNGLLPYKDFNIIQTPLSAFIASIFISVFGDYLFVFRIAGFVLIFLIFSVYFNLVNRLCKSFAIALFTTVMCVLLIPKIYNYNHLLLLFVLFILWIELYLFQNKSILSQRELSKLDVFIIFEAIIAGSAPLIKQTTGCFLLVAFWIVVLFNYQKQRISFFVLLLQIFLSVLPMLGFLVYLLSTDSFVCFMDYAFFGINNFTHRYSFIQFIISSAGNFLIGLIVCFVLVFSLYRLFRKIGNREVYFKFLILFIAFSTIAYPLCDQQHFYLVFILVLPLLFYSINYKKVTKTLEIVLIPVSIALAIISVVNNECIWVSDYKLSSLKHYNCIPITVDIEESIYSIDDYIIKKVQKNEKVIIADVAASAIKIPIDCYDKDFDMLLVGNVGTKTVQQLAYNLSGSLVMVTNDIEGLGMQDHYPLIEYIKEKGVYCESIEGFEVYKM